MAVRLPGELSEPELNEFASLVLEGGEVQPNGLEQRIKGAYRLGIIQFEAEVFAVGAVDLYGSGGDVMRFIRP